MFAALGATPEMWRLRINDRVLLESMLVDLVKVPPAEVRAVSRLIDRWEKLPAEALAADAAELGLSDKQFARLTEALGSGLGLLDQLPAEALERSTLVPVLRTVPDLVSYDPLIVRGLDYYTGTVFEIFDTDPANPRALFGGGRYSDLAGLFTNQQIPGIGFAVGDVTLPDFLATHGLLPGAGGGDRRGRAAAGRGAVRAGPRGRDRAAGGRPAHHGGAGAAQARQGADQGREGRRAGGGARRPGRLGPRRGRGARPDHPGAGHRAGRRGRGDRGAHGARAPVAPGRVLGYADGMAASGSRSLLVAANRGPVSISAGAGGREEVRRGGGGLVSGMVSALSEVGGLWVCAALNDRDRAAARRRPGGHWPRPATTPAGGCGCSTLDPATFHRAYNAVANSTLWFVHHLLYDTPRTRRVFDARFRREWESYQRYNEAFATRWPRRPRTGRG